MKFALVDNTKTTATKGAKGICPNCGSELIAKCGDVKMNHWAHRGIRNCDPWWEPESEWHRTWKNNYPDDWQEISLLDERTGEKHIADVRTAHNLVVEFQHSYIDPQERTSREQFYRNMVWIVDGTRLKRDYPRFLKGKKNCFENTIFYNTDNPKIFRVDLIDWCFPSAKGLCGNDDCGQMSAWHLFSTMGFYPLNPAGGEYLIGAPQMEEIALQLPGAKTFLIKAINLSPQNIYVQYIKLNGQLFPGYALNHRSIMNGGVLEFVMGAQKPANSK